MLATCLDFGYPTFILEKSDMVLRDMDIIKKINKKSGAAVAFSIITSSEDKDIEKFEPGAPPIRNRFKAMKQFAENGVLTGTLFMPCLPYIYDTQENLEDVVRLTAENGFVLFGSLTLSDNQRDWYYSVLKRHHPDLIGKYDALSSGQYAPDREYHSKLAKQVAELCNKHGISDRMPRIVKYARFPENRRKSNQLCIVSFPSYSAHIAMRTGKGHYLIVIFSSEQKACGIPA